jgi:hypothetical protein
MLSALVSVGAPQCSGKKIRDGVRRNMCAGRILCFAAWMRLSSELIQDAYSARNDEEEGSALRPAVVLTDSVATRRIGWRTLRSIPARRELVSGRVTPKALKNLFWHCRFARQTRQTLLSDSNALPKHHASVNFGSRILASLR